MTYQQAKDARDAAQNILNEANDVVAKLQSELSSAQSALDAFHFYTIDIPVNGGDISYSNFQFPSNCDVVNDRHAEITTDTPPASVMVDVAHYDTTALTWGDPVPTPFAWTDNGQPA